MVLTELNVIIGIGRIPDRLSKKGPPPPRTESAMNEYIIT